MGGSGLAPGDALATLLYVSELAAGGSREIPRICEQSRANNERDGITGLLVFDGKYFCQYMEGGRSVIAALLGRLETDPRHVAMRLLQHGPAASPERRFPTWRLGYAYVADPASIDRLGGLRGTPAVEAFADMAPPEAASDAG